MPIAAMGAQTIRSDDEYFDAATNQATQTATKAAFPSPTGQLLVAIPRIAARATATIGEAANGKTIHGIFCAWASRGHRVAVPPAKRIAAARLLFGMLPNGHVCMIDDNADFPRCRQRGQIHKGLKRQPFQSPHDPGGTPEQLAAFVRSETAKWSKVVKDSGAKVD